MKKKILVLAAHPDDETLGCGATISKLSKQGHDIKLLTFTDGVSARDNKDKGFQWTRRIIALTAVFAIVVLPKLVAVFSPDVDVTVGYTVFHPGFLFFTSDREAFEWITFKGLVITQLDTNLVSAIIGMYFVGV